MKVVHRFFIHSVIQAIQMDHGGMVTQIINNKKL